MPAILIKADEFKYPTRDELKIIKRDRPRLKAFGFPYVHEIAELVKNIQNMHDVARRSHLYWWDRCLINRLGSLSRTYTAARIHFNRGIPDEFKDYHQEHYVNRSQFGYYGEMYFYFFISARDTIAHLLNIYYSIGIKENKLFVNDQFCNQIPDRSVRDLVEQFMIDTKLTAHYRNGLAHRFLLTHPDYRPSINYDKGGMMFEAGSGDAVSPGHLVAEIKTSFTCLAEFLGDLQPHMPS